MARRPLEVRSRSAIPLAGAPSSSRTQSGSRVPTLVPTGSALFPLSLDALPAAVDNFLVARPVKEKFLVLLRKAR
jgi:hypothetical protein